MVEPPFKLPYEVPELPKPYADYEWDDSYPGTFKPGLREEIDALADRLGGEPPLETHIVHAPGAAKVRAMPYTSSDAPKILASVPAVPSDCDSCAIAGIKRSKHSSTLNAPAPEPGRTRSGVGNRRAPREATGPSISCRP